MLISDRPPQILYEEDGFLVLYKPDRYYIHPPENKFVKKQVGRNNCVHWLWDTHHIKANPIHRLDFGTEGLVIFGKDLTSTQKLNIMMKDHQIKKFYDVIVRGWFKNPYGQIDLPLELDSTGDLVNCLTLYSTLAQIEFPTPVHSKFSTSRYAWIEIELKTGRWHQIRRHMNRVSHPVIGDREHGDSHHNRFFRDNLAIDGLCLKAKKLKFVHPFENKLLEFECPMTEKWQKLKTLFFPADPI